MQPHEVNMDLVMQADVALSNACVEVEIRPGVTKCVCPTDDQIRVIIAAVHDSIYQAGYGFGYTDGFVDKGDLEGA